MGITFSSKMFPIPFNVEVSLFVVSYILLRFFVTSSTWGCGEWFCETPDPLDPSRRAKSPPFDRTPVYVIFHTSPPYDKRANLSLQLFNKIGHGISEVAQQPTVHRSMLSGCTKNLEPKKHSFFVGSIHLIKVTKCTSMHNSLSFVDAEVIMCQIPTVKAYKQ